MSRSTLVAPTRCSIAAALAGDSPVGTAPPARQWFLVEHPGPWGRLGYAGSGLDPIAVDALAQWAQACGGRVVLIRRPGRAAQDRPPGRRWFRVDSRPGRESIRTGVVTDEHELRAALADPAGDIHDEPLVLVCAHGRHDTCCAVSGRPVAAALARAEPEAVWECSHIGGCRFAPTMVLLPHGFVFGTLPEPAAALQLVTRYRAATVDERWMRGRSSLPPVVQAAQHAARTQLAAPGVDALKVVELAGDERLWTVRLAEPDCVVRLEERRVAAGRPLTCAATNAGWLRTFDIVSVTPA
ncbi:MAG TPA: sucrase ferredoxin [Pseudonocardia sp.]